MKYRPNECPKCRHNHNDAYCIEASNRKEIFKGESQRHCYAFYPKQNVAKRDEIRSDLSDSIIDCKGGEK